jgi:hypothetical protein
MLSVAGAYVTRWIVAAVGTAFVLPGIQTIGLGWFSTVSAIFLFVSEVGVYMTIIYGRQWREHLDSNAN